MPTYDFRCKHCRQHSEVQQSMSAPVPTCPSCGGGLERWFHAAPVVHGVASSGREQAIRSLPQCGKGCRCCP